MKLQATLIAILLSACGTANESKHSAAPDQTQTTTQAPAASSSDAVTPAEQQPLDSEFALDDSARTDDAAPAPVQDAREKLLKKFDTNGDGKIDNGELAGLEAAIKARWEKLAANHPRYAKIAKNIICRRGVNREKRIESKGKQLADFPVLNAIVDLCKAEGVAPAASTDTAPAASTDTATSTATATATSTSTATATAQ